MSEAERTLVPHSDRRELCSKVPCRETVTLRHAGCCYVSTEATPSVQCCNEEGSDQATPARRASPSKPHRPAATRALETARLAGGGAA
jgi:hypothetical protein